MSVEGSGTSSGEITDFIENAGENISKNCAGVFPANEKNRFTDISNEIKAKQAKYSFMIANTDLMINQVYIDGHFLI